MGAENKCPVAIFTGFLGSGKTTVLGHILHQKEFAGTSVIVNEYGQAGLDHRLLRRIEERTTLLSGGCVCCNRRDDLIRELEEMLNAHQSGKLPLDRVIIETTGLADPAPILFSILTHPRLMHHYYIELVAACLDSANGELHLRSNPESIKQIVAADKVIVTKTDLVGAETVDRLRQRIAQLNPAAEILTAAHGNIDADLFAPSAALIGNEAPRRLPAEACQSAHTTEIRSMAIQFDKPLDWLAFGIWMSLLLQKHGENMFRVKGIVDVGEQGPIVLNGVQHIIHPPQHLPDWRDYETRNSQIVFIMKDIEPQQILDSLRAFQSILGAAPEIQEVNLQPLG